MVNFWFPLFISDKFIKKQNKQKQKLIDNHEDHDVQHYRQSLTP